MFNKRLTLLLLLAFLLTTGRSFNARAQGNQRILTVRSIPLPNGQLLIEPLGQQQARIRLGPASQIIVTAPAFAVAVDDGDVKLVSIGDAETVGREGAQPIVGSVSVSFQNGSATFELFAKRSQ